MIIKAYNSNQESIDLNNLNSGIIELRKVENNLYFFQTDSQFLFEERIQIFIRALFETLKKIFKNLPLSSYTKCQWQEVWSNRKVVILESEEKLSTLFVPNECYKFEEWQYLVKLISLLDVMGIPELPHINDKTNLEKADHLSALTRLSVAGQTNTNNQKLEDLSPIIYHLIKLEELSLLNIDCTILNNQSAPFLEDKDAKLLPDLTALTNLKKLHFVLTQLTAIPQAIYHLKNLERLDLSYNRLTTVSEGIKLLPKLNLLDLTNNKFEIIPESLYRLPQSCKIHLSGNPVADSKDYSTFKDEAIQKISQEGYSGPKLIF